MPILVKTKWRPIDDLQGRTVEFRGFLAKNDRLLAVEGIGEFRVSEHEDNFARVDIEISHAPGDKTVFHLNQRHADRIEKHPNQACDYSVFLW